MKTLHCHEQASRCSLHGSEQCLWLHQWIFSVAYPNLEGFCPHLFYLAKYKWSRWITGSIELSQLTLVFSVTLQHFLTKDRNRGSRAVLALQLFRPTNHNSHNCQSRRQKEILHLIGSVLRFDANVQLSKTDQNKIRYPKLTEISFLHAF